MVTCAMVGMPNESCLSTYFINPVEVVSLLEQYVEFCITKRVSSVAISSHMHERLFCHDG